MPQVNQDALDYSNEAQFRVAYDTRSIIKKTTLAIVADTALYALPDDVIELLAVSGTEGELGYLSVDEAMTLLSVPSSAPPAMIQTSFYVVGTQIGVQPVPTDAATLTLTYQARPAALTSATEFELAGEFELLVDRLVQAMKLDDDGQPELALAEQGYYSLDAIRLRRRVGREPRARASVVGYDLDT